MWSDKSQASSRDLYPGFKVPCGPALLHNLDPIVYLLEVTQLPFDLEDRTGGAAPWTTFPASAA
jgi:hypothetical protein